MQMREYAVHADNGHFHEYAGADENLIHISNISIFAKNGNFLGQKWISLALFSILSALNIIIVHPSWFYSSSVQNYNILVIFFYYLMLLMRIDADANIGT